MDVCDTNLVSAEAEDTNLNEATSSTVNIEKPTSSVECDNAISSTTSDKFSTETDTDFFSSELSMSNISSEKITENVEDIVQDLENLLGESSDNYSFVRDEFNNAKVSNSNSKVNSTDFYKINCDLSSTVLKDDVSLNVVDSTELVEVIDKEDIAENVLPSTSGWVSTNTVQPESSIMIDDVMDLNEDVQGLNDVCKEDLNVGVDEIETCKYTADSTEDLPEEMSEFVEDTAEIERCDVDVPDVPDVTRMLMEIENVDNNINDGIVAATDLVDKIESHDNICNEQLENVSDCILTTNSEDVAMDNTIDMTHSFEDKGGHNDVVDVTNMTEIVPDIIDYCSEHPNINEDISCIENVDNIEELEKLDEEALKNVEEIVSMNYEDAEVESNIEENNIAKEIDNNSTETKNNVSVSNISDRHVDLIQPLTVEVGEPNFNEQQCEIVQSEIIMDAKTGLFVESSLPKESDNQAVKTSLKMTISKNKTDNVHSILKIYDPSESIPPHEEQQIPKLIRKTKAEEFFEEPEDSVVPKITIKPVFPPMESQSQHSPKITIKPIKPPTPTQEYTPGSPKITIKPIMKPDLPSPLKLTIRPIPKMDDSSNSPKLAFKSVKFPEEPSHHKSKLSIKPISHLQEALLNYPGEKHSPRITIKPVLKPEEVPKSDEAVHSPRITIKPIYKPPEEHEDTPSPHLNHPFKLNIKPLVRPSSESNLSPKITKPAQKPEIEIYEEPLQLIDFEEQIKQERIVLKIPKKDSESDWLQKIKLKLSKEDGLAHIVPLSHKRPSCDQVPQELKHFKSDLTISLVTNTSSSTTSNVGDMENVDCKKPIVTERKPVCDDEIPDPLADIPVFEITLQSAAAMSTAVTLPPTPRKRGRPRKVPLEVREEFKDPREEDLLIEPPVRPKRSCRGSSARATLGIRTRKPRGSSRGGRGRGRPPLSSRGSGRQGKERRPYMTKARLARESMLNEAELKQFEIKDGEFKQVPIPGELANRDVVIYEEETCMSADNSSRAQTPAKQVLTSTSEAIDESQSSIQSNTTTESGEKVQKSRKGPRLETHQEPEGEVISADKLAEYSWGGGGPYMLQEQVAQFLGIKSFKRKYPDIHRRPVDMQERDFIRESCLASEAMCDMGLTAVKSEDILDIMYSDFEHKYEEYCKHQRDRQAKDVSNKQKALSLAASQEKTKLDIVEQAVQSAFQWNNSFNKARREQRRACMDLQTLTVHYPKGRMKQINKLPIGNYPLALVPGQFTDYYRRYSPFELSKVPLNTIGCKNMHLVNADTEDSQSDGSGSDSDSSSSDSDSSDSCSGAEDCKMCTATAIKKLLVH